MAVSQMSPVGITLLEQFSRRLQSHPKFRVTFTREEITKKSVHFGYLSKAFVGHNPSIPTCYPQSPIPDLRMSNRHMYMYCTDKLLGIQTPPCLECFISQFSNPSLIQACLRQTSQVSSHLRTLDERATFCLIQYRSSCSLYSQVSSKFLISCFIFMTPKPK